MEMSYIKKDGMYHHAKKQIKKKNYKRAIQSAQRDRLTSTWATTELSIDSELQQYLPSLRARMQEAQINDDYIKRFFKILQANVVGNQGFNFQSTAKTTGSEPKQDKPLNESVEKSWKMFSKKGNCDVTTQLSLTTALNQIVTSIARDGEIFIRIIPGYDNKASFAFQLLASRTLSVDHNIENFNKTGNVVRMGVELNDFRRPVAYHFETHDTRKQDYTFASLSFIRVPAEEVLHIFLPEFLDQTRGLPWGSTALLRARQLHNYESAALTGAINGASSMAFIETESGTYDGDDLDLDSGDIITDVEPGTIELLPSGAKVSTYDPNDPHTEFSAFIKAQLRGVASGLGLAYHSIANDLEGISFSSIRSGVIEERMVWVGIQQFIIDSFLSPVYEQWLKMQLLQGSIKVKGFTVPMTQFEKLHEPVFIGRRWEYVDVAKETKSNMDQVEAGFKTVSEVIRQQGKDPDEIFNERRKELDKMAELDILPTQKTNQPTIVEPPEDN